MVTSAARRVVRKPGKCWKCGHVHECYDISPDHGWRKWAGEGMPWYVQPPKDVAEPCGGCGKPRLEHGFDA